MNLTESLMMAGGTRRISATAWRRRGSNASSRVCWTWRPASGPPTCQRAPPSPSPSPTSTRPIPTISRFASRELCTVSRGSGMFFPDPTFFHPGSASKNSSILTKKNGFQALENMIRVVHPGSGCWLFTHPGSRIQGPKRHRIPDPEHWLCIRKPNSGTKSRQKS